MKKVLRLVSTLILFGLTLEVAARVDDFVRYRAPLLAPYTSGRLRTTDEDGIRRNVPNARFEKYANNSLGFRGPEIEVAKAEGTTRIVCLGASETYGLYEEESGEWPARLREMLPASEGYEVINAAVVGQGLRSYRSFIEKYVLKLEPDLMIVMVSPQSYTLQPLRDLIEAEPELEASRVGPPVSTAGLRFKSRLLPKFKLMVKSFLPDRIIEPMQIRNSREKVLEVERRKLKGKAPFDLLPAEIIGSYKRDLGALVVWLNEQGIDVILVGYPSLFDETNIDEHPYIMTESRRFYVYLSPEGMIDASQRLVEATRELAAELGTGFVDLNGQLPHTLEIFADNVHYTDAGAERVAKLFAESVSDRIR